MRIPRLPITAALLLSVATPSMAKVWVVGPAAPGIDFSQIQPAVDAAQSGDIILVRSGGYDRFTIDGKALTVQADVDGPVLVGSPPQMGNDMTPFGPQSIVRDIVAGDVVLRGMWIRGLEIDGCSAPVLVEACTVDSTLPATRVVDSDGVAFLRCTLEGPDGFVDPPFIFFADEGPGLELERSTAVLNDCTVVGGDGRDLTFTVLGTLPATSGRSAVCAVDSTLVAVGGTFTGGDGGDGGTDGLLCSNGGDGGHGLHLKQGANVAQLRSVGLVPGAGGAFTGPCPFGGGGPGATGNASQVDAGTLVTTSGTVLGFLASSPVREQGVVALQYTGSPGDTAVIALSPNPTVAPMFPLGGALLVAPPLVLSVIGPVPASGGGSLQITVPELGAGVDGLRVVLQGLFCGVGCELGPASVVVALDGAL